MVPNVFLLAADNSASLLPLLRENPALASSQDDHGYSLIHAAASYNHLDLLRELVNKLHVDVNLKDEDNETALFVVETIEAARVLIEELHIDVHHRGLEGLTAAEKLQAENEFPDVASYVAIQTTITPGSAHINQLAATTTLPDGMTVTIGTMEQDSDIPTEVDESFRRRIEELAGRDDFHTEEGQADLRKLVEDALSSSSGKIQE